MKLRLLIQFLAISAINLPVGALDDACFDDCWAGLQAQYYTFSCYISLDMIIQCVDNARRTNSACPSDAEMQTDIDYYQSTCPGASADPTYASSGSNPVSSASNFNTASTVAVYPNDPRIKYDPASAWKDTSSSTYQSGTSSCNNGTKVTQDSDAKFTFDFSGTNISLFLVPSTYGGDVIVQIDGDPATTLSTYNAGSSASDQCIPSSVFTKTSMSETTHRITVQNGPSVQGSGAGTLEFNNIVYKGRDAVGTNVKKSVSEAMIGGSIGGVLGAVLLTGAAILFFVYRKKKNYSKNALPIPPNQPIMSQQAMAYGSPMPLSPFSIPTQSSSPVSMDVPVSAEYLQTLQSAQPTSSTHLQATIASPHQSVSTLSEPSGNDIRPLSTWSERSPNNDRGYM